MGNQPNQHHTIHVGVGHIYYSTKYVVLDSISDNEQLIVLYANGHPLQLILWLLHELRQNMNTIRQFRPCEAQINQSSNQATV